MERVKCKCASKLKMHLSEKNKTTVGRTQAPCECFATKEIHENMIKRAKSGKRALEIDTSLLANGAWNSWNLVVRNGLSTIAL